MRLLLRSSYLLLLFCSLLLPSAAFGHGGEDEPKIVFISPSVKEHSFWYEVGRCMEAAAEDLSLNFEITYPKERTRFSVQQRALEVINSASPPDYLIYIYHKGLTGKVLEEAEAGGIRSFIFNTDIPPEERAEVGKPMERFKNWIGHLTVDDEEAGRLLAQALLSEARRAGISDEDGNVHMVGISGGRESSAALERNAGLASVVEQFDDVVLHQVIFAYWKPENASFITAGLLKRYPGTQVIWTASDSMALAAVKAARKHKDAPEILVGGIDWTRDGIEAVRTGELAATVGGHFMDGAWSLVLVHDYHHKRWGDEGHNSKSTMTLISAGNVQKFQSKFKDRDWRKIDFEKFSRVHNPNRSEYDFNIKHLFSDSITQPESVSE